MAVLNDLILMLELSVSLAKSVFVSKDFLSESKAETLNPDLSLSWPEFRER